MSTKPAQTMLIEVPVTLRIAVAFPDGEPADRRQAAEHLAQQAARRLTRVSDQRLKAFNAVNKIHDLGDGEICSVVTKEWGSSAA